MKKVLVSLLALLIFTAGIPFSASAHPGCSRHARSKRNYSRYFTARTYGSVRYRNTDYRSRYVNNDPYYEPASYAATYRKPSFYRRHRNLINTGIATGGGTLLGALIGGRKGALIGALTGAGAGAVYTYGINKKKRRY